MTNTPQKASNIPEPGITLPVTVENPFTNPILHNAPGDDEYTHGVYNHRENGQKFALCVRPPNAFGRTHFAKNTTYSWEGTEAEFRAIFDQTAAGHA